MQSRLDFNRLRQQLREKNIIGDCSDSSSTKLNLFSFFVHARFDRMINIRFSRCFPVLRTYGTIFNYLRLHQYKFAEPAPTQLLPKESLDTDLSTKNIKGCSRVWITCCYCHCWMYYRQNPTSQRNPTRNPWHRWGCPSPRSWTSPSWW